MNYLLAGISIVVAAGIVFTQFKKTHQKIGVDSFMGGLAQQTVENVKRLFGIDLDYSIQSVESIEKIVLAKLHEEYRQGQLSEEALGTNMLSLGAYIGEVIKRAHGASWAAEKGLFDGPKVSIDGGSIYIVTKEGTQLNVCAWCHKRITNGLDDNVWAKFQISMQMKDVAPGQQGGPLKDKDGNTMKIKP